MNTPQEFEKIALWMGKRITHFEAADATEWPITKTSLADAECIEALNRLVEKGHEPFLTYVNAEKGWSFALWCCGRIVTTDEKAYPTINQAVEQAIAALIKAERGGGE